MILLYHLAECKRKKFIEVHFDAVSLQQRIEINRSTIFDDVIQLYTTRADVLLQQVPLRVKFVDEDGVDFGGVGRDFFSAFWEQA